MENLEWAKTYLLDFEQRVMVDGFVRDVFKKRAEVIVPLRKRKLHSTGFAKFIGDGFDYNSVLAFNYYGLFKVSTGTKKVVESSKLAFPDIRTIKSQVVHFNSIKIEHVKELAPDLLNAFPDFKKVLVSLRGF